jgi:hypothetical protein
LAALLAHRVSADDNVAIGGGGATIINIRIVFFSSYVRFFGLVVKCTDTFACQN